MTNTIDPTLLSGRDLVHHIRENNVILVRNILKSKPELATRKDEEGRFPLCEAAQGSSIEIIHDLLKSGADIEEVKLISGFSITPLVVACQTLHVLGVSVLIKRGAKIHTDVFPLILKLLINFATSGREIIDQERHNFIEAARDKFSSRIDPPIRAIRAKLDEIDENNSERKKACKIIEILLKGGMNIETLLPSGNTPLLRALKQTEPNMQLIKLFIKYKANVNALDALGGTPLLIATKKNHPVLAEHLSKYGADPRLSRIGEMPPISKAYVWRIVPLFNLFKKRLNEGNTGPLRFQDEAAYLASNHSVTIADPRGVIIPGQSFTHLAPSTISKMLSGYIKENKENHNIPNPQEIIDAFKLHDDELDLTKRLSDIKRGKLVVIQTGFIHHAIHLIFYRGHFGICNSGLRRDLGCLIKIDPTQMTGELLQEIAKAGSLPHDEAITFFYTKLIFALTKPSAILKEADLPDVSSLEKVLKEGSLLEMNDPKAIHARKILYILSGAMKDPLSKAFNDHLIGKALPLQKDQKGPHCVFSSAKAALFTTIALQKYLEAANKDDAPKIINKAKKAYKDCTTLFRLRSLMNYLKVVPTDSCHRGLLKEIQTKLLNTNWHPERFHSEYFKRLRIKANTQLTGYLAKIETNKRELERSFSLSEYTRRKPPVLDLKSIFNELEVAFRSYS